MRLLNEGRYTVLEFLVCSRHATPNFDVPRPQPLHINQPVNVLRAPSPVLLELPPHPSREEIMARLLPPRIRQPIPQNSKKLIIIYVHDLKN